MMELMIPLNRALDEPLYEQIYSCIRDKIRCHDLKSGTRLPSTRALADFLGVSRSTTQIAYEQLASEGYIEAIPCKGYYVMRVENLNEALLRPVPLVSEQEDTSAGAVLDFSPGGVDINHFPYSIWRKLSGKVLSSSATGLFSTGNAKGEAELRKAVCGYLNSSRNVNCHPDQVIIGAGSEYLLMLLHQILPPGTKVAMENPTYHQVYRVFKSLKQEVVPVGMDQWGMDIGRLESSGADLAYVMPSHQFPLGIVMPIQRRQELMAWTRLREERYIIEDDYDSEFRYRGMPIPSLQGSDPDGRVIYLGTFSKSIAPAIRVSYMVLPEAMMKRYHEKLSFYTSTVSRIDQMILAEFISGGYFERHLNKMRAKYKAKHDCLLNALKPYKNIRVSGEQAGTHLLLSVYDSAGERELVEKAALGNIKVYGLSSYVIGSINDSKAPTVILGYAGLTEAEIQWGVAELAGRWGLY